MTVNREGMTARRRQSGERKTRGDKRRDIGS
jgi:hypothetical protein